MKKSKYTTPGLFFVVLFPFVCLISTILCAVFQEWIGFIITFLILIFVVSILIIYRKKLFLKMIINENGIITYYRNNIEKKLDWEKIIDAQFINESIFLSDNKLYIGKERWKNFFEVSINLNRKLFAQEFYKYIDKIPVNIRGLENLPRDIQERLKNK